MPSPLRLGGKRARHSKAFQNLDQRSEQPHLTETEIAIRILRTGLANNDMIQKANLHDRGGILESAGEVAVRHARVRVPTGMIVRNYY